MAGVVGLEADTRLWYREVVHYASLAYRGLGYNNQPHVNYPRAIEESAMVQPRPVGCDPLPPVIAFSAPSGTGKTTLLEQLIAGLAARGWRVGVIKQARPDFELDQPGKDSDRLRKAGIERLMVAAESRSALIIEPVAAEEPELDELLRLLDPEGLDLILVEGFRHFDLPRIGLYRGATAPPLLDDPHLIAVVGDRSLDTALPQLPIDQPDAVLAFVLRWCRLRATREEASATPYPGPDSSDSALRRAASRGSRS